jgi:hypothetical protein
MADRAINFANFHEVEQLNSHEVEQLNSHEVEPSLDSPAD